MKKSCFVRWAIAVVFCTMIVMATGSTVWAESATTTGTITKVDQNGKGITFQTPSGKSIVGSVGSKKIDVFRGDKKIDLKDLKVGDKIWITYRPTEKKNDLYLIKTEPNIEKETKILKEKIARATRILNMEGLVAFSGHLSARIPGTNTFWIQPSNDPRGNVVPERLCEVTLAGKQISGPAKVPDETDIHASIYRARPDVNCVLHIHPHYIILPSLVGKDLIPVSGHGAIFGSVTPMFPHPAKVSTPEDGDKLAKAMGDKRAVVLKGHGAALGESTVEAVVTAAMYMEENAQLLSDAYGLGTPIPLTAAEIAEAADETYQPSSIDKTWDYYIDKGYKNSIFWDKKK